MNENRTRLTHSTLERRRQMVEPADFFIKGSLTVSISGFILVKSSEMFSQGTLWLAVGFFMVLASISILSLGLTALASSASAFQALLSSDPPKRGFSELAKKCFSWLFAILVAATLIGLFRSMGFLMLP